MHAPSRNATRPFRTPFVPVVPLLAVASCGYLMLQLPWETWVRFILWLALGLVFYFAYGASHSELRKSAS